MKVWTLIEQELYLIATQISIKTTQNRGTMTPICQFYIDGIHVIPIAPGTFSAHLGSFTYAYVGDIDFNGTHWITVVGPAWNNSSVVFKGLNFFTYPGSRWNI